ncbi:nitroreductase family protein [Euzebya tangerina]|uniref:nitroreductase family protein n=1 Tax=Euzebya tangerina TaxID=591198 RepID=UPI000E3116EA|nr:nitroreductase family protein [Euzebya tangerina]
MEFTEVVRRRRMVRDYDPDREVSDDVVRRALEAAIRAPSAGFSQGWDFLVLRTAEDRQRYWDVTAEDGEPDTWLTGMTKAPVLIVCLGNEDAYYDRYAEPDKGGLSREDKHWPVDYWDVDTGMAALLILQTAVDEGLGGCLFGVPVDKHAAVRDAFDIPANRSFVGVVSLGYPAQDETRLGSDRTRDRRGVADVAHEGRFGRPLRS